MRNILIMVLLSSVAMVSMVAVAALVPPSGSLSSPGVLNFSCQAPSGTSPSGDSANLYHSGSASMWAPFQHSGVCATDCNAFWLHPDQSCTDCNTSDPNNAAAALCQVNNMNQGS